MSTENLLPMTQTWKENGVLLDQALIPVTPNDDQVVIQNRYRPS